MGDSIKIVFCGGGALRLLGVVDSILALENLAPNPQLVFMDLDLPRARTMAALATKVPAAARNMPDATATDALPGALDGADFVYCCIRVGSVTAMERDERIGARHGFHGHDDFGPSGVMLTARTVPVVLSIARQMEQRCPDAILLIFTNPITNMVDAVTRYTSIRSIGICPGVYNFMWDVDALFDTGVPVVSKFLNEGQVPPHKRLAVPHQERIADDFWTPRAVLQPRNVRHLIGITS